MKPLGYAVRPLLVMTRTFEAARETVFDDWIRPEHLARWWSAATALRPTSAVELRAGDVFRFVVRGPDGNSHCLRVGYREIVRPERVVFVWGNERLETETVVTARFSEVGGRTRLELAQTLAGWGAWTASTNAALDRLARMLATTPR
jgi:uncharacterized protein YndB with AHSA1/START domain